jgi:cysteine desulfurase/selenocysteine lyase
MPNCAVSALNEAIKLKEDPSKIADDLFFEVPKKLKSTLGQLFHVPPEEIILGDSATYTINILVNGIKWKKGDEILLEQGDFPTNIFPWLALKEKGVIIKMITPCSGRLSLQDLANSSSKRTRAVCLSWVNSFDGHIIDIDGIGEYCQQHNILFILNGSQAFGYKDIDLCGKGYIDVAFSCGFKWLLGPYGTGFGWMKKQVIEALALNRYYWLNQYHESLKNLTVYELNETKNYLDIFNTANFFNYIPWESSLSYLLQTGISNIQMHNKSLVDLILNQIDKKSYKLISPELSDNFSSLIVLNAVGKRSSLEIYQKLRQSGFFISLREDNLRITPHLYNGLDEAEHLVNILNS